MSYPPGMPEDLKRCEECGEPTTVVVSDLDEVEPVTGADGRSWLSWTHREHHAYCGAHARCSLHYRLDGTVEESCSYLEPPCESGRPCAGVAT